MRIVVRALDVRGARHAQERLAQAGCEAMALVGADAPAPEREDILIIAADRAEDAVKLALAAQKLPSRPLAVLIARDQASPPPAGLSAFAPFDGAIALDAPPKLLARQIAHAARLGCGEEERARRRLTAAELGVADPAPLDARKLKALYIGAPSPFFLALERAIAEHDGAVTAAFTSYTGFDHLHDEVFDAVVLNGAADTQMALSLCAALRRNATLANLPTMMVTTPGDARTANLALERGAAAVAGADQEGAPALGWLFDAIRRERRRRSAEHDILALRDVMGDARSGLFTPQAFEAHLARLADDHHATGRPLALVALKVLPAPGARRPPDKVWRKGFNEIASLASRLVRDCDSGAAFDGSTIVLALPFTDARGGRRAAERVASVAECTAFATGDDGQAPLVFEQSVADLQPGESGAGLMARARRLFDLESARA